MTQEVICTNQMGREGERSRFDRASPLRLALVGLFVLIVFPSREGSASWAFNSGARLRAAFGHDKRRFFTEARAVPPPIFGLMTNSRILTL